MNANSDEMSSAGLSLQSRVIVCPKCRHERTAGDPGPDWQCPSCGIAYNKATGVPSATVTHLTSTSGTRGREAISRDDFGTFTPGAISFALKGRIGRLRYLAFALPTIAFSALLGVVAALTGSLHKPNILLLVSAALVCFWLPLRSMALRMHDLNQSAKWVLALLLLPGVFFAIGKPQLGALSSVLFWIVAFLLVVVPGSDSDNDYGPPPGANTTWVTLGASLVLALMALGVVANFKYRQYAKLHPALAAPAAQGQSGPANGQVRNK